ncbi:hypothetical protein Bca4012_013834 [Brassica carinata]
MSSMKSSNDDFMHSSVNFRNIFSCTFFACITITSQGAVERTPRKSTSNNLLNSWSNSMIWTPQTEHLATLLS